MAELAVAVFKENGLAIKRLHAQEAAMRTESETDLQSSMSVVVAAAAAGDFSRRIEKDYEDENLNQFAGNINTLLSSVDARRLAETRRVIASLAVRRDLTRRPCTATSRVPSPSCSRTSTTRSRRCRRPCSRSARPPKRSTATPTQPSALPVTISPGARNSRRQPSSRPPQLSTRSRPSCRIRRNGRRKPASWSRKRRMMPAAPASCCS